MTKKNLRSYINYCSKSGCLLQSEGGSLPIATPLGRRIDRATVKNVCFSSDGCADLPAPSNARHLGHRGGEGRARRGAAPAAGKGGSPRPNPQHIVSLKGKGFASGEQRGGGLDGFGPAFGGPFRRWDDFSRTRLYNRPGDPPWCNGSTEVFGTFCPGSNPGGGADAARSRRRCARTADDAGESAWAT